MIPKLSRISQHTFDRIGNQYAHYIDGEHFMGRSAIDDVWTKRSVATVRVQHEADQCLISVALPGFKKKEIHLYYEEGSVYLSAIRKKGKRSDDRVNRVFSVPPDTDLEKIEATFRDHQVEVVLPKISSPGLLEIKLN